jgi:hypothetical protein
LWGGGPAQRKKKKKKKKFSTVPVPVENHRWEGGYLGTFPSGGKKAVLPVPFRPLGMPSPNISKFSQKKGSATLMG